MKVSIETAAKLAALVVHVRGALDQDAGEVDRCIAQDTREHLVKLVTDPDVLLFTRDLLERASGI